MKASRGALRKFLWERERVVGGYTGEDLTQFARANGLRPSGIRARVSRLRTTDPAFFHLHYLGKRRPSLAIDDYAWLIDDLDLRPLASTTDRVVGLNAHRADLGLSPLPERSLQRLIEELSVGLNRDRTNPLLWFQRKGIPVSATYTVPAARAALGDCFSYRDLTTPYGVSLRHTLVRLQQAEAWFAEHHPGVRPHEHYERLRPRAVALPGFLASLHADRSLGIQGRFIFELMAIFLVEGRDFLLSHCRSRAGRFQQAINAGLQREQCDLLDYRVARTKATLREELERPAGPDRDILTRLATEPARERDLAMATLRLSRAEGYERLLGHLRTLTRGFHPEEIRPWGFRADVLLCMAREEVRWSDLPEVAQTALGKHRRLLDVVPEGRREKLLRILLTERLLHYLHRGKLTLSRSWVYQDLSRLVAATGLPTREEEWPLPPVVLEELLTDGYRVDLGPLREVTRRPVPLEEDEQEEMVEAVLGQENFTEMAREVHRVVREHNPDWFAEHRRVLETLWDGAFRMEYTDEEYAEHWVASVGFLGRNCRVREDPDFRRLEHFLRRCVVPATMELDLGFMNGTLSDLTGITEEIVLTDTMGVEGRRTHALATYHPRYHTRGLTDLRGIGGRLVPATSLPCSSWETEAMNGVELMARSRRVLGDGVRLLAGNGHTVSRVSAGLLLGTFGVVSAGHLGAVPALPSARRLERLRKGLPLLNKVFVLLRERPDLGRLFCSRSHIFVAGENVRGLIESVGCLVLRAVAREGITGREVQPYIESSNRQKRVVRVLGRGEVRAQPHHQAVHLMAGELILAIAALRTCLRKEDPAGAFPTIDLDSIAFFKPA